MPQIQTGRQQQRQSPQQYLISTMVQSTADELVQLINQELEKNITLEAVDPIDTDMPETAGNEDDEDALDTNDSMLEAEAEADADNQTADNEHSMDDDSALSDDERGAKLSLDYDDDTPGDGSSSRSAEDDDYNPITTAASEDTFRDNLKSQIDMLEITEEEQYLAHYIIDCLDEDGYLRRSLYDLVDDLEFTQHHTTTEEDLESVLVEIVQEELEPSGIGARDLRECMLLQLLDRKATPAARLAYEIVNQAFDDLSQKRYDRIEAGFGITSHQLLVDALRVIRHLNPKPGNMQPVTAKSQVARVQQVRPDFTVRNEDGQLVVSLNDSQVPEVRISAEQEQLYEQLQQRENTRDGVRFLREAIQGGRNFIDALQQRRNTLLEVMQTIVQMQRAYFLTGLVETLKPMKLQDVAERCQYDISTISRVSNSKYIDTDFGIIPVDSLFTNAVADTNQTAVIEALRSVIESEDKHNPLTDDALTAELERQGYSIARRTVVKYRTALGIPVARLRREA